MKNYKKTKLLLVVFVFMVVSFVIVQPAQAQTLNIDYPAVPVPSPDGVIWFDINDAIKANKLDIIGLLVYIYAIVIWLAAMITFITLVYTSTRFIVSGSSSGERNKAKKRFYNISWGVLILLFSWFLLNFINPNITDIEQSLFVRGIFDPNPLYESAETVLRVGGGTDPAIAGTFSCEWTGSSCATVEPNNCNPGYFAGNCSQVEDADFCTEVQNAACTESLASGGGGDGDGGDGGDCYDECAAQGKSFSECTEICGGEGGICPISKLSITKFGSGFFNESEGICDFRCYSSSSTCPATYPDWCGTEDSRKSHSGFDIYASCGTPTVAPESGTVVSTSDSGASGCGKGINLGLDSGITLRYCHLNSINVVPLQAVAENEQIGTVGDTGTAKSGCHLHIAYIDSPNAASGTRSEKINDFIPSSCF